MQKLILELKKVNENVESFKKKKNKPVNLFTADHLTSDSNSALFSNKEKNVATEISGKTKKRLTFYKSLFPQHFILGALMSSEV